MPFVDIDNLQSADLGQEPVRIAERVWWVGHKQADDPFQCHVYLIEQGKQSVLIDPGSRLTFRHTLRKIEEIIPFSFIRYFICHHQDPDIVGAMPTIDELISRQDAVLVTHGRARVLIQHYGVRIPFWLVEEHEWKLSVEDRELQFIFTPYAHFPGAFCSFDRRTRVLFSSDIFGGFTPEFSLLAQDERYFDALRPFHEHYMPSREILGYALDRISSLPLRMIAPQHGSIIPEPLVRPMITRLKGLECGLYLTAGDTSDVRRVSRMGQNLHDIHRTLIANRDFKDVASGLLQIVQRLLPAETLEFYTWLDDGSVLHLAPRTRYRGVVATPPPAVAESKQMDRERWRETAKGSYRQVRLGEDRRGGVPAIILPLFSANGGAPHSVALIRLRERVKASADIERMVEEMMVPLQVAVDRETLQRVLDMERQRFYEQSIRDPLTGLFSRLYMQDTIQRLLHMHDRDPGAAVAVAMIDIDHFKEINDTYGHSLGDEVLRRVAQVLSASARGGDLPARLGGEEFALFVLGRSAAGITQLAQRLRQAVAEIPFDGRLRGRAITVSIGTAIRRAGESLNAFIERADHALYEAKRGGRNRVCEAA